MYPICFQNQCVFRNSPKKRDTNTSAPTTIWGERLVAKFRELVCEQVLGTGRPSRFGHRLGAKFWATVCLLCYGSCLVAKFWESILAAEFGELFGRQVVGTVWPPNFGNRSAVMFRAPFGREVSGTVWLRSGGNRLATKCGRQFREP